LVWLYAALVWGVCRRRLARREDAEDAFQATFLILAVKAGSIRAGEALPGWLHWAACRASIRVASAPPGRDREEVPAPGLDALAELARREAAVAVDEELVRLPGRYREPLVLFHLEGLERREVADRLGLSEPAVKALLARGRSLLRNRLARRGFALPMVIPFLADPLPAEAAANACRLAGSFARSGLSPFDLVASPVKGWGSMFSSVTGKTAAVATAGAVGLTLLFAVNGPAEDGAGGSAKNDAPDAVVSADAVGEAGDMAVAAAEEPKRADAAGVPPSPAQLAEEQTLRALGEEAALDLPPETTLEQAIDLLRRQHRFPVAFAADINKDERLKLDASEPAVKTGRLGDVLRTLLRPLGLTYAIDEHGILIITPPRSLVQIVQDRSYDVSTLRKRLGSDVRIAEMVTERLTAHPPPPRPVRRTWCRTTPPRSPSSAIA
jgi:RNA polymerase sigma factor (sigma-70 family)